MNKAIIIFDTLYGNTEKIANSLANGLLKVGIEAKCVNVKDAQSKVVADYDLIAVGAPTHYFTSSKHMRQFLERLKGINLKGKAGFAFDTKLDSHLSGSASKFIEKRLAGLGLEIIRSRVSAIVIAQKKSDTGGEAILKEGMEELFEQVGNELGKLLDARSKRLQGIA